MKCFLKNKPKHAALFVVLLLVSFPLAVSSLMNYSGYCSKEGRYLTKQELIDSAVSKLDVLGDKKVFPLSEKKSVLIPALYKDLASFYELNPDCCQLVETIPVEGFPYRLSFFQRLSGAQYIAVKIFYIIGYDINKPDTLIYAKKHHLVDNCGNRQSMSINYL